MAWRRLSKRNAPIAEYQFDATRKWKFDFAWPKQKVALEIQGGTYIRGRHTRGAALHKEYDKLNSAVIQGWSVLLLDTKHCDDIGSCVSLVENLLDTKLET